MNFIESSVDDFRLLIQAWAAPDQEIETARGSLDIAVRAMRLYEEKFWALVSPTEARFGSCAWWGGRHGELAMHDIWAYFAWVWNYSNQDFVAWFVAVMLDEDASAQAWQTGASLLVHELAHQWFGDIVTMWVSLNFLTNKMLLTEIGTTGTISGWMKVFQIG